MTFSRIIRQPLILGLFLRCKAAAGRIAAAADHGLELWI